MEVEVEVGGEVRGEGGRGEGVKGSLWALSSGPKQPFARRSASASMMGRCIAHTHTHAHARTRTRTRTRTCTRDAGLHETPHHIYTCICTCICICIYAHITYLHATLLHIYTYYICTQTCMRLCIGPERVPKSFW